MFEYCCFLESFDINNKRFFVWKILLETLFISDFCTRENWQTAVLYLAGEMETLGLPSPCTKVNMYKSNYVQENSCTSRGNGNHRITIDPLSIVEYY